MRICFAVPTFWTYPGGRGEEEVIYDHPTPLDADGTLVRFLDSALAVAPESVRVVVVAAATAEALQNAVEERVGRLLARYPQPRQPLLFSYSQLRRLTAFCEAQGYPEFVELLSLSGYAAVRNLTLAAANLLDADILVSLDDDEILADPGYLIKIEKDFNILAKSYDMFGLAGFYESPGGDILAAEPAGDWVRFWPKIRWMNAGFIELAGDGPDLKLTPLALGGNMAVGARLYRFLPFDPGVVRGEDIDYVINARIFQVPFFMDSGLRVVHDPPAKPHPIWRRLRQDLQRFWYTRQKLLSQDGSLQPALVNPAELMPYPGNFLTEDLEMRAYRAHTALAREYLALNQPAEAYETLLNLSICEETPAHNVFQAYLGKVAKWRRLQSWLNQGEVREAAREMLWG